MTTEDAKQTAETILSQLGGNKFTVMTGARSFMFHERGALSFKLPGKSGINHVHIELNSLDLYNVEFRRVTVRAGVLTNKLISEHKDVYADMLRGIFEKETGLRTSLTAVYA